MKSHGFRVVGDTATCLACGTQAVHEAVWRCPVCRPVAGRPQSQPRPGLGDIIASGLKRIGITEERVKAVTGLKDCGCGKRQAAANRLGTMIGLPPGSTAES